MSRKIVIGISGASGAIYAKRLLQRIEEDFSNDVVVDVVFSKNAEDVWKHELDENPRLVLKNKIYAPDDFYAPFASGSAKYDTMIICPCSMGTIGRIASGISSDLISRAADVILKENRKLIIIPRESPYNLIHLKNMTLLKEAGAVIIPATPSFYSKPKNITDIIDTVVDRVLSHAGFDAKGYQWGE